jgi:copper oxidase (laccase) domain-containing protein
VVTVDRPGAHAGEEADAAVTDVPGCVLAVLTADCAPVVLVGERAVGVAHAGWRGLLDGVLERTIEAMAALGDPPRRAHLGPCIRPGCYEFAGPERDLLVARFGPAVAATTAWGTPAVDLPGAVAVALGGLGVPLHDDAGCTACDRRWYSHRARAEVERFATTAWVDPG